MRKADGSLTHEFDPEAKKTWVAYDHWGFMHALQPALKPGQHTDGTPMAVEDYNEQLQALGAALQAPSRLLAQRSALTASEGPYFVTPYSCVDSDGVTRYFTNTELDWNGRWNTKIFAAAVPRCDETPALVSPIAVSPGGAVPTQITTKPSRSGQPMPYQILLSRQGYRVATANCRIGYESAYYSLDPNDANYEGLYPHCRSPNDKAWNPELLSVDCDEPPPPELLLFPSGNFARCHPNYMTHRSPDQGLQSTVWAGIQGAEIYTSSAAQHHKTLTNSQGAYSFNGLELSWEYLLKLKVYATVNTTSPNPRVAGTHQFLAVADASFRTLGEASTFAPPLTDSTGSVTVEYLDWYYSNLYTASFLAYANFPIEAATLDIRAVFTNAPNASSSNPSNRGNPTVDWTGPLPDNFAIADLTKWKNDPNAGGYVEGDTVYSLKESTTPGHSGLLKAIGDYELRDTEVFVYRASDDKLIGSRWGMLRREVLAYVDLKSLQNSNGAGVDSQCEGRACLRIASLFRGPEQRGRISQSGTESFTRTGDVDQLFSGIADELYYDNSEGGVLKRVDTSVDGGVDGGVNDGVRNSLELDYDTRTDPSGRTAALSPGDALRIIVINRATGYIGTARAVLVNSFGFGWAIAPEGFGFDPATYAATGPTTINVEMRPPNLKVRAYRISEQDPAGDIPYLIGSEGSSLTSDSIVYIETEWLDHDGRPLPADLPGYTGRLAKLVATAGGNLDTDIKVYSLPDGGTSATPPDAGTLDGGPDSGVQPTWVKYSGQAQPAYNDGDLQADATGTGDQAGFFRVRPGKHTTVVRLKDANPQAAHFYIHIDAKTLDSPVDFTGTPGPAKPNFSITEFCYWIPNASDPGEYAEECKTQGDPGAGEGALMQRPGDFVPFKVPFYNAERTLAAMKEEGKTGWPAPGDAVYDWYYRPEMQFSMFDLKTQGLAVTLADGTGQTLDSNDERIAYRDDLDTLALSYTLLTDADTLQLETFDGTRSLIFSLGDQEQKATIGTDEESGAGTVAFTNVAALSEATPNDYATIRLSQNEDEPNVLWDYDMRQLKIVVEDHGEGVSPGDKVSVLAKVVGSNDSVEWEFVLVIPEGNEGKITQTIVSSDGRETLLTVPEDAEEGKVILKAWLTDSEEIQDTATIDIGCGCASDGCPFSVGKFAQSSIDIDFSLGSAFGGATSGSVSLHAETLADLSFTPMDLRLDTLSEKVRARYDTSGLRQVLSPETVVDIIADETQPTYSLTFYRRGSATLQFAGDGTYDLSPLGPSVNKWVVSKVPDGSSFRLRVLQDHPGRPTEMREYYTAQDGSLVLAHGTPGGAGGIVAERTEELRTWTEGSDKLVLRTVKNSDGSIASQKQTRSAAKNWGYAVVEEIIDPSGAALTTTTQYYENAFDVGSYSKPYRIQRHDGSWTQYLYDDKGRLKTQDSSWLSIPIGPNARKLEYTYPTTADSEQDLYRPSQVSEYLSGAEVARSYLTISRASNGSRIETETRCSELPCSPGSASAQVTTRHYAAPDTERNLSGRLEKVVHPDGTETHYRHEEGTVDGLGTFSPGTGEALRTTTTRYGAGGAVVDGKSEREVTIVDEFGKTRRTERLVATASGFALIDWTEFEYDEYGHVTRTERSNGEVTTAEWGCCTANERTDSRGIATTVLERDGMQRVVSEQRAGITTTYELDALGRQLSVVREGGGAAATSGQSYDGAGRLLSSTDASQLTTSYAYDASGRITTVSRPGGLTEITERHADGQTKSLGGTAVVPQSFAYSVAAGTRTTRVQTGTAMWQQTTVDMLGRTVRVERPGYGGTVEVSETFYNDKGQVERTSATGQADTLYEYDDLGNQIRSGLDINGNGQLDAAGPDRITDSDSRVVNVGGDWWQQSQQWVYPGDASSAAVLTSLQRSRLTGFGAGVVSEQHNVDLHGNMTVSRVEIDRASKTETRTTDVPDSNTDVVAVSVLGRLTSSTSQTGVVLNYGYDGLGRRTSVTHPRTGTSTTVYDTVTGRVDEVVDAAGNRTRYEYDPTTGRKTAEFNALDKSTRYEYNARGQLTRTWGNVPYPVEYEYDEYGRRTGMWTFRSGDFSGASWPAGVTGDKTTWQYEGATGLLLSKLDAANQGPSYTYGPGGRLATRTWARGGTTTYGYDDATGELLSVDYSDPGTPDIGYTYDRLGRQKTVTDAVGTRTFVYDPDTLQLVSEDIDGVGAFDGVYDVSLTRKYEPGGSAVAGRSTGFQIGDGSSYDVTYDYDAKGRFGSLAWSAGGASDAATYSYVPSSNLLAGMTTTSGQATSYQYEPLRDLKTQVQNSFGGSVVSQYDYRYDAIGRRESVQNSGSAFGATAHSVWGYDDRNQLTASDRYTGLLGDTSSPVGPEKRSYGYDPIGNRQTALGQDGTTSISYTPNELNQYVSIDAAVPVHDLDGNMTSDGAGKSLSYNGENRLVGFSDGTTTASYVYDYIGRRVSKAVVGGATTTFLYDGWNMIREDVDADGAGPGAPVAKHHVWGLDLSQSMQGAGGIGGLIAVVDSSSGDVGLFAFDGNGNVSEVVVGGLVDAHYEYDAFGNVVLADGLGAEGNPYRFSTKYFDGESGYSYYGHRYYEPVIGRWINRDPVTEKGAVLVVDPLAATVLDQRAQDTELARLGVPIDIRNSYEFAKTDPISHVDLFGLSAWRITKPWGATEKSQLRFSMVRSVQNYRGAIDCADLALVALIAFASENGLPIVLKAGGQEYNASHCIWSSKAHFERYVRRYVGANQVVNNTVPVPLSRLLPGHLIMTRRVGRMGHTRIVTRVNRNEDGTDAMITWWQSTHPPQQPWERSGMFSDIPGDSLGAGDKGRFWKFGQFNTGYPAPDVPGDFEW
ncbi:MAG: hypothetical protein OEZ06_27990 [Myxococcales bacterium]|nr:hypothetical protein [Myxococcales bacterium]